MIELANMRGLSQESLLMQTLGMARKHARAREIPVVVLDREGKIGAEVFGLFRAFVGSREDPPFELVGIRASDKAHRNPIVYDRMRDELAANLIDWIRDGGALLEDAKLAAELHTLEWIEQTSGRVKVTPKRDIKKELGRSPDRYDALALSVWVPASLRDQRSAPRRSTIADRPAPGATMDPYAAAAALDPYAAG